MWRAVLTRRAKVVFVLLLTRRRRVEEERWEAGLTRLVKSAVGFLSLLFHLCVESRSIRWWLGEQRDNGIELAKTTVGSSLSEETSKSHVHDDGDAPR